MFQILWQIPHNSCMLHSHTAQFTQNHACPAAPHWQKRFVKPVSKIHKYEFSLAVTCCVFPAPTSKYVNLWPAARVFNDFWRAALPYVKYTCLFKSIMHMHVVHTHVQKHHSRAWSTHIYSKKFKNVYNLVGNSGHVGGHIDCLVDCHIDCHDSVMM